MRLRLSHEVSKHACKWKSILLHHSLENDDGICVYRETATALPNQCSLEANFYKFPLHVNNGCVDATNNPAAADGTQNTGV